MTERDCMLCGVPVDRAAETCPWCGADLTGRSAAPDLPGITGTTVPFERSVPQLLTQHDFEPTPELDEYVPFRHELHEPAAGPAQPRPRRVGLRLTAVVVIIAMVVAALGATAWLALVLLAR